MVDVDCDYGAPTQASGPHSQSLQDQHDLAPIGSLLLRGVRPDLPERREPWDHNESRWRRGLVLIVFPNRAEKDLAGTDALPADTWHVRALVGPGRRDGTVEHHRPADESGGQWVLTLVGDL